MFVFCLAAGHDDEQPVLDHAHDTLRGHHPRTAQVQLVSCKGLCRGLLPILRRHVRTKTDRNAQPTLAAFVGGCPCVSLLCEAGELLGTVFGRLRRTIATAAILGHFSKSVMLLMIPQVSTLTPKPPAPSSSVLPLTPSPNPCSSQLLAPLAASCHLSFETSSCACALFADRRLNSANQTVGGR